MNIIFLIIVTVAVVHGAQKVYLSTNPLTKDLEDLDYTVKPCEKGSTMKRYNDFVKKHILKSKFNRENLQEWTRHLERKKLCGRVAVQSFIDATEDQVKKVCHHDGLHVSGAAGNRGNLCISTTDMDVYHVDSIQEGTCNVTKVTSGKHKVVLACDKVKKQCLPVHYERYQNQNPGNLPCMKS